MTRPAMHSARYLVVGTPAKAPAGDPPRLTSMGEYELHHGTRDAAPALYDDLAVFFAEGGREAFVAPTTGPTDPELRAALAAAAGIARGGAVAAPGIPLDISGEALADHAALHQKIALLHGARDTMPEELADQAYLLRRPDAGDHTVVLWPWVTSRDTRYVPPTGYAAAVRARVHAGTGYWGMPAGPYSASRTLRGLRFHNTQARNEELSERLISPLVASREGVQLHGWWTLSPDRSNFPLATVRDLLNNVAVDLDHGYQQIGSRPVRSRETLIAQITAHTRGVLSSLSRQGGLVPLENDEGWSIDPGYRYTVEIPEIQPADRNVVEVRVSVRPHRHPTLIGVRVFHVPLDTPLEATR